MHQARPDSARSPAQRWAAGILGALLLGCAVFILGLFPLSDWQAMLAALLLLGLGFDALLAAWQARPSLLSRIGPLP